MKAINLSGAIDDEVNKELNPEDQKKAIESNIDMIIRL
jgi:hypothetical protein